MVRLRRGLAIGGHGIRATRGHRIQGSDGVSLIAHRQSIQSLFDASQTGLQVADGRGLMDDGRLGTGKGLLYSLQLRGVLERDRAEPGNIDLFNVRDADRDLASRFLLADRADPERMHLDLYTYCQFTVQYHLVLDRDAGVLDDRDPGDR